MKLCPTQRELLIFLWFVEKKSLDLWGCDLVEAGFRWVCFTPIVRRWMGFRRRVSELAGNLHHPGFFREITTQRSANPKKLKQQVKSVTWSIHEVHQTCIFFERKGGMISRQKFLGQLRINYPPKRGRGRPRDVKCYIFHKNPRNLSPQKPLPSEIRAKSKGYPPPYTWLDLMKPFFWRDISRPNFTVRRLTGSPATATHVCFFRVMSLRELWGKVFFWNPAIPPIRKGFLFNLGLVPREKIAGPNGFQTNKYNHWLKSTVPILDAKNCSSFNGFQFQPSIFWGQENAETFLYTFVPNEF